MILFDEQDDCNGGEGAGVVCDTRDLKDILDSECFQVGFKLNPTIHSWLQIDVDYQPEGPDIEMGKVSLVEQHDGWKFQKYHIGRPRIPDLEHRWPTIGSASSVADRLRDVNTSASFKIQTMRTSQGEIIHTVL